MSDYLIHYGVKGMKWGVRKSRPSSGRSRKKRGAAKTKPAPYKLETKTSHYTPKDPSQWYSRPSTTTTTKMSYKNTQDTEAKRSLDKMAANGNVDYQDYGAASMEFDSAMNSYFYNVEAKGEDYARSALHSRLKDYSYDFVVKNVSEDWDGQIENYVTASLEVYGNTYMYGTSGEKDYSDDQYFDKIRK